MISDRVFQYALSLLQDNYDKTIPETIKAIWHEHLNEHLTDEELATAVKYSILHSRFMPTANDIVEYIHGGKEAKALQEWQMILKASTNIANTEALAYLSQRARLALQAIGGLRTVGMAEEYRLNQLEKHFITVYCQCAEKDAKSLPQVSSAHKAQQPQEEVAPVPDYIKQKMEDLKNKLNLDK